MPEEREQLPVIVKTYDFLLWLLPKLDKLPKNRKFTLGDRMENAIFDVLLNLVEAAYSRNKRPVLERANLALEKLRFLLRICRDLGLLSQDKHRYAIQNLTEIGRMVGGWLRQQARKGG